MKAYSGALKAGTVATRLPGAAQTYAPEARNLDVNRATLRLRACRARSPQPRGAPAGRQREAGGIPGSLRPHA